MAHLVEAGLGRGKDETGPCKPDVYFSVYRQLIYLQVMDVAQGLANLAHMPQISRTLSLPGPSAFTIEYLLQLVESVTMQPPSRAPVVPKWLAMMLSNVATKSVWWPTLTPDEVVRRYIDDVDVAGDWEAVGVAPTEIDQHAITYLRRYRSK